MLGWVFFIGTAILCIALLAALIYVCQLKRKEKRLQLKSGFGTQQPTVTLESEPQQETPGLELEEQSKEHLGQ